MLKSNTNFVLHLDIIDSLRAMVHIIKIQRKVDSIIKKYIIKNKKYLLLTKVIF